MLDDQDFDDLLGFREKTTSASGDSKSADGDSLASVAVPYEMDERAMAGLLRLSLSMVRTKAREGVFVRSRPGRYDVLESVGRYAEALRKTATGRPASGDSDELRAEKLRLTRAQADKEETRVAKERGELVPADAVSREWAGVLRDLRNALLAVPSRCGATLPHLTATDIAIFDRELRLALEGVANGN